jgi:hypothetical protein
MVNDSLFALLEHRMLNAARVLSCVLLFRTFFHVVNFIIVDKERKYETSCSSCILPRGGIRVVSMTSWFHQEVKRRVLAISRGNRI